MFIFLAIIGLSVLVFFHEFGHFIVAKILGIKVEEFGIGYPPRIFGIIRLSKYKLKFFWGKNQPAGTEGKTIYSFNWIPFGGFNKLKGELDGDQAKDSFFAQAWWKKILVAIGGTAMNIVLAMFIFSILYFTGIPQDISSIEKGGKVLRSVGIQIGMVAPDSPADQAEIKIGDIIMQIDGQSFDQIEEIQEYIKTKINQSITIEIKRGEEIIFQTVEVQPYDQVFSAYPEDNKDDDEFLTVQEEEDQLKRGVIGVALSQAAIVRYPFGQAIVIGIKTTFILLGNLFYGIWLIIKTLITKGEMVGGLLGPVGIATMTAEIAKVGYIYYLQFLAFLSVAIGAFQIIPFPALDGSRVLFAIIEGIKGKPISHKIENIVISLGFYLLVTFLLYITVKEILLLF